MFKGRRVILKWSMNICHTGMPGIAGIREKAQIREPKSFDHLTVLSKKRFICLSLKRSMNKHKAEHHQT